MNYYEARQIKTPDGQPSGLWHYTQMNDGRIWPTGYCAEGCPGHPTPEEAQEHQRQYLLDHARYDRRMSNQMRRCRACDAYTDRYVEVNGEPYVLCDAHHNRESLDTLVKCPERSMSSW